MTSSPNLATLAPVVAFMVLLELASGAIAVTAGLDLWKLVGRGFTGTTSLICLAVMGIALLVGLTLPDPSVLLGGKVPPGGIASLLRWSAALTVLLALYALFSWVGTDVARRVVGVATVAVAAVAIVKGAGALGPPVAGTQGALAVFFPAALLAGSTLAGMLLGHWYLISPDLSFRPLRASIYVIFAAVAVDAVVISIAVATAAASQRHALFASSYSVVFWLLVIGSGIVFTAAVNALTLYFALIRANQPATAMLYAVIISALMGVIPAHLIFFETAVAA